jgi:Fe-S cluster assembly protein SufD
MTTLATEKNTAWLEAFDELQRSGVPSKPGAPGFGSLGWKPDVGLLGVESAGPAWLRGLRERAFARFWELGFPTTHHEDWRFTNISAIANGVFLRPGPEALRPPDLEPFRLEGAACELTFVNGIFAPALSRNLGLPAGVVAGGLASASPDKLEAALTRAQDWEDDSFAALNLAFLEDGAYIFVPRGAVLERPIHILYVTSTTAGAMAHPRNLMVFGEQSQAAVIEDYVSLGNAPFFTNAVTELEAGDDAVIEHYLLERESREALNVSTLNIRQGRTANVASHAVLLGGRLVRNNVHPRLLGEGGECLINGLFIAAGRQHMDNYMKVEHQAPHCGSRQFYNGILDEHSHGVFHGRIIVHKGAQKTDAKQTNRNLLLSDDAQIDTKPQLEIYADDVKCTHGATIGQLDDTALFYLRSRGVPESDARRLLLSAFANESLGRMKSSGIRQWLESSIAGWLPRGADVIQSASGDRERHSAPASQNRARRGPREEVG